MKILITGCDGFVGRHFIQALDEPHHELTLLDVKNGPSADVREYVKHTKQKFDLVIHCAAIVGGREQIDGDPLSIAENLAIDSDLFRWAVRTKQRRVLYFSSSAVYPVSKQTDAGPSLHEDDQDVWSQKLGVPDKTYGWAKLTGEMLAMYARLEGLKTTIVRPFSGYGTDQPLDYPFPSFVQRGLRHDDPFRIWGSGEQARDWIHIDDVVRASLDAVDLEIDGPVNLCTGRATSFRQLAKIVADAVGYDPQQLYQKSKPTGVQWRVGDPTLLNTFYKPQITLEEGVKRALEGY